MKALSLMEFMQAAPIDNQELYNCLKLSKTYLSPCYQNQMYANYLNQPFTPELIVDKFKGWVKDNECDIYYYKDTSNFIECEYDKIYSVNGTMFFIPRTLADFINDCQRAGIELEFKEQ